VGGWPRSKANWPSINPTLSIQAYISTPNDFTEEKGIPLSVSDRASNLPIRSKILVSFMAVMVVLAALGLSALHRSSSTNDKVKDITGNYGLAVVYLDEMRVAVSTYRGSVVRQVALYDDKTVREAAKGVLATARKTFDENNA
jgi:hypothetical protein